MKWSDAIMMVLTGIALAVLAFRVSVEEGSNLLLRKDQWRCTVEVDGDCVEYRKRAAP